MWPCVNLGGVETREGRVIRAQVLYTSLPLHLDTGAAHPIAS